MDSRREELALTVPSDIDAQLGCKASNNSITAPRHPTPDTVVHLSVENLPWANHDLRLKPSTDTKIA